MISEAAVDIPLSLCFCLRQERPLVVKSLTLLGGVGCPDGFLEHFDEMVVGWGE